MAICCPWRKRDRYDDIDDRYERISQTPNESSSLLGNGRVGYIPDQHPNDGTLVDAYIASYRSWEDDVNLWSDPYDITHTRCDQDKELDSLIRKWRTTASQSEKKTIYEKIQAIRQTRKRVQERWLKVLIKLGFEADAGRLVSISRASGMAAPEPPTEKATDFHHLLVYQTAIFGDAEVQDRRYTIILDRLIDLDVADDFIQLARQMYPREPAGLQQQISF
ncbi:melanoregulin-like [Diadema setosum]|uniref:melanoregulin-like n=1 Tax=Diadema setosum TaxID=31175 RepID=UPI003B3AF3C3